MIRKDFQLCVAHSTMCIPGPAAETLPREFSEMHILGPTPDVLTQKSGCAAQVSYFNTPSR